MKTVFVSLISCTCNLKRVGDDMYTLNFQQVLGVGVSPQYGPELLLFLSLQDVYIAKWPNFKINLQSVTLLWNGFSRAIGAGLIIFLKYFDILNLRFRRTIPRLKNPILRLKWSILKFLIWILIFASSYLKLKWEFNVLELVF